MSLSQSGLQRIENISSASSEKDLLAVVELIRTKYPTDKHVAACLARISADSGGRLVSVGGLSADVASTGSPTSLSTLLCPLFLRAGGAVVPKLGVPGRPAGGIDCLAQLPGYRATLNATEVERVLNSGGYAHFLAHEAIAPLDRRIFQLRQQHNAQQVPTLVAASLLSKKIAVGVTYAGLDVRVAPFGNFGTTWEAAGLNAELYIKTARLLSVQAVPVLTDARYPYQPYIGRSEALTALDDLFNGTASNWLNEHFETCKRLALACLPPSSRQAVQSVSLSQLRDHFYRNLIDQGSTPEEFSRIVDRIRDRHRHELRSTTEGFVHYPLEEIRTALVSRQRQYSTDGHTFPDPVGIILYRRPGDWVTSGEILATVRIDGDNPLDVLSELGQIICRPKSLVLAPNIEEITSDE